MRHVPAPEALLQQAPSIMEAEIDGDVVLMSMDAGHCYGLNGPGSAIWRMLQGTATLSQIQANCSQRFAGDTSTIASDVSRLLSELLAEGLIEPATATARP